MVPPANTPSLLSPSPPNTGPPVPQRCKNGNVKAACTECRVKRVRCDTQVGGACTRCRKFELNCRKHEPEPRGGGSSVYKNNRAAGLHLAKPKPTVTRPSRSEASAKPKQRAKRATKPLPKRAVPEHQIVRDDCKPTKPFPKHKGKGKAKAIEQEDLDLSLPPLQDEQRDSLNHLHTIPSATQTMAHPSGLTHPEIYCRGRQQQVGLPQHQQSTYRAPYSDHVVGHALAPKTFGPSLNPSYNPNSASLFNSSPPLPALHPDMPSYVPASSHPTSVPSRGQVALPPQPSYQSSYSTLVNALGSGPPPIKGNGSADGLSHQNRAEALVTRHIASGNSQPAPAVFGSNNLDAFGFHPFFQPADSWANTVSKQCQGEVSPLPPLDSGAPFEQEPAILGPDPVFSASEWNYWHERHPEGENVEQQGPATKDTAGADLIEDEPFVAYDRDQLVHSRTSLTSAGHSEVASIDHSAEPHRQALHRRIPSTSSAASSDFLSDTWAEEFVRPHLPRAAHSGVSLLSQDSTDYVTSPEETTQNLPFTRNHAASNSSSLAHNFADAFHVEDKSKDDVEPEAREDAGEEQQLMDPSVPPPADLSWAEFSFYGSSGIQF